MVSPTKCLDACKSDHGHNAYVMSFTGFNIISTARLMSTVCLSPAIPSRPIRSLAHLHLLEVLYDGT
jgi:hypothetical protein